MAVPEGARTVADVKQARTDMNGVAINIFYGYNPPDYCLYRANERVMIQFADDRSVALQQRSDLAPLTTLRNEIEGLVESWRETDDAKPSPAMSRGFFGMSNPARMKVKAERFDWRVSGALVQALEKDVPGARIELERIKADIMNERVAYARFEYLLTAVATALALMFVAWFCSSLLPGTNPKPKGITSEDLGFELGFVALALVSIVALAIATVNAGMPKLRAVLLSAIAFIPIFALFIWPGSSPIVVGKEYVQALNIWRAASAGAVGAFFSISLAIRGRTVLTDLLRTANMMDALLRVTVGFIGGTVLMALIDAKMVQFHFGDVARNADAGDPVLFVLIIGFIAGFSERFVPDLLDKASATPTEAKTAQATPAPAPASPSPDSRKDGPAGAGGAPAAPTTTQDNDDEGVPDTDMEVGPKGFDLGDDEVTQDDALPPAQGGVAPA